MLQVTMSSPPFTHGKLEDQRERMSCLVLSSQLTARPRPRSAGSTAKAPPPPNNLAADRLSSLLPSLYGRFKMDKLTARGHAISPGYSESLKPGLQQPVQFSFTAPLLLYNRGKHCHSKLGASRPGSKVTQVAYACVLPW